MVDLITLGETRLRLSAPGKRRFSQVESAELYVEGVESNVAAAAACLNADTAWISKLPKSPLGNRIKSEIRRHEVETLVNHSEDGRVGLVFEEGGVKPRPDWRAHYCKASAAATITPDELPMERIQTSDVLFSSISTTIQSDNIQETIQAMFRAGKGGGAATAIYFDPDPNCYDRKKLRDALEVYINDIDYLFVNLELARNTFDIQGQSREVADQIISDYNCKQVIVIQPEMGAVSITDTSSTNVIHERGGLERVTVDESGVNESFIGAFLTETVGGSDTEDALEMGIAASAIASTEPGPLLWSNREEINRVVESNFS